MSEPRFGSLETFPLDEAFALTAAYNADSNPSKVSLGAGVYRDDEGQPWRLNAVIEAKKRLDLVTSFHEYLPIHGSDPFLSAGRDLLFGSQLAKQNSERIASIQTISGTGANSLATLFLAQHLRPKNVWIPDPTWNNHHLIWTVNAPEVTQRTYPHYNSKTGTFDFEGMMEILKESSPNDVLLLHACAHNPTGLDPSEDQWKAIASICIEKGLFVLFDTAYQGFASGSVDTDAWAVRYFLSLHQQLDMLICQSFSKNFGLYGERVGALHVVVSSSSRDAVFSQLVRLQRAEISNPPTFGSRVVTMVLNTPELYQIWEKDLTTMSSRIKRMRAALYEKLVALGTPGDWKHVVEQIGMFSFTGLSPSQVQQLRSKHVYMMLNGRASICGLTPRNVDYVAKAIHDVVTSSSE